jgi:hypothetical protein
MAVPLKWDSFLNVFKIKALKKSYLGKKEGDA